MSMQLGCVAWTMASTPFLFLRPIRQHLTRKHWLREGDSVKLALDMGLWVGRDVSARARGRKKRPPPRRITTLCISLWLPAVSAVVERRCGASLWSVVVAPRVRLTALTQGHALLGRLEGILPCPLPTPGRHRPGMRWACGSAVEEAGVSVPCMCLLVGIKTQNRPLPFSHFRFGRISHTTTPFTTTTPPARSRSISQQWPTPVSRSSSMLCQQ